MAEPKPIPTSYNVASAQVTAAQNELYANYGDLPELPWRELHNLVGRPLPRDLWVIAGRTKQGKSTFTLALFDHLVQPGWPALYIGAGAEGPPKDLRRQWAALRCGYAQELVLENRWSELPADAQDRLFMELQHVPFP